MTNHDERIYASQARLMGAVAATDLTRDELLTRARDRAIDPAIIDEFPPHFFGCRISTGALDSWGTDMDVTSLQNYARDAKVGVTVLDTHNVEHVIGKSVDGRYVDGDAVGGTHSGQETSTQRAESVFAIIPGQRTATGMHTDDYINQLRFGSYRDISIGFWLPPDGHIRCSICGKRMNEWMTSEGCFHFPGMWYEVDKGDEGRQRVYARGTVVNGGLSEYSPVYDGATPGAEVMAFPIAKATDMDEADALDRGTAERLMQRFQNVRFTRALRKSHVLGGLTAAEDDDMVTRSRTRRDAVSEDESAAAAAAADDQAGKLEEEENPPAPAEETNPAAEAATVIPDDEDDDGDDDAGDDDDPTGDPLEGAGEEADHERLTGAQIRALQQRHAESGITFGADAVDVLVGKVRTLKDEKRALKQRIRELETDAAAGKRYRGHILDGIVKERARLHKGDPKGFDEEAVRARYDKPAFTIEDLEAFHQEYADESTSRFPAGQRLNPNPDGDPETPKARKRRQSLVTHGDA